MTRWRRGSLALIFAVALIPAVTSLILTINYGQAARDRHVAQDGADALALLHATWTARSLNQISMNNVEAAQLLTVAIGSEALDGALDALERQAYTAIAAIAVHSRVCPGFGYPPAVAACFAAHVAYMEPPFSSLSYVDRTRRTYDPKHGIRVSHDGLRAINAMNREIVARFPRAMGEIASEHLADLGLTQAHFSEACDGLGRCRARGQVNGMSLPVEPGGQSARTAVCLGMRLGTLESRSTFAQKGFGIGRGPMSAGGPSSNPDIQRHINQETRIGRELESLYRYLDRLRMISPSGLDPYPRWANFPVRQRNTGVNEFSARFTAKETDLCTGVSVPVYGLDAPVPEFWSPKGSGNALNTSRRSMDDAYKVLAIAHLDRSDRVGLAMLEEPVSGHFAYAQAVAYNPDGVSLFSQNWRASRVPASKANDPAAVANDLIADAAPNFDPLANVLAPLSGVMETLNAH